MDIILGTGINNICFGMNEGEVIEILGLPTKRHFNDVEGYLYLEYYPICTKFKFDEDEGFKLTNIETSNRDALIFGEKILGREKNEVIALLNSKGYTDFDWEDYEYFDELFCEKLSLWITFEYDRVTALEFFLFSNENDDEFLWPEIPEKD